MFFYLSLRDSLDLEIVPESLKESKFLEDNAEVLRACKFIQENNKSAKSIKRRKTSKITVVKQSSIKGVKDTTSEDKRDKKIAIQQRNEFIKDVSDKNDSCKEKCISCDISTKVQRFRTISEIGVSNFII